MRADRFRPRRVLASVERRARRALREARVTPLRTRLWTRAELVGVRRYRMLGERELRERRTSDTVFVFGSGYSINDLTPAECAHFEDHDTLAFNWFAARPVVRIDFHLVREMAETDWDRQLARDQVARYCRWIAENPCYERTALLVQRGFRATGANLAVGAGLLPARNPVYRWRSIDGERELSGSLESGLTHLYGALSESVNFAVLMGWATIVLVGVDLYDRRYFWLGPDETDTNDVRRGSTWSDVHQTALSGGIVDLLGAWADELAPRGVELEAYNPRSLLTRRLPVYERVAVAQP